MSFAPIVLFVYNRPLHTKRVIESLIQNDEFCDSELYIYADGVKSEAGSHLLQQVEETRQICRSYSCDRIHVIQRERNFGLALNIIKGVSEVIEKHGKVIVLEDDILVSPKFLKFMNDALRIYEKNKKVWHVTGWSYPFKRNHKRDIFFWQFMNCWGWATWSDRWKFFEKDPKKLLESFTEEDIRKFTMGGLTDSIEQIKANISGKINTWAVFWYATIYKNDGLCMNPIRSFVENIGMDGSGVHCGNVETQSPVVLSLNSNVIFQDEPDEIPRKVMLEIENYYNKKSDISFVRTVLRRIKKIFLLFFYRFRNS